MSFELYLVAGRTCRLAAGVGLLGLVFSLPPNAAGQTGSMRVSLPSPTAATLGKFGDVPVSLYTGVPDVTIPIFTAKGRTLELPIVLKYHASGIRVEEIGGWVGIGWTLEAGGAITRTVRGVIDENNGGYWHTGHNFYNGANWPDPSPQSTIVNQIRNASVDGEPDRFFFSFAGRSGQFVMGPTSTSPTLKEIKPIPYQKIRIEATSPAGPFVITSEDGTRYTFNSTETTADFNILSTGEDPPDYGIPHASSWHLTEIRSVGGDVISFFYTPYRARHRTATYSELFVTESGQCNHPGLYEVINEYEVEALRLDSIKTAAHTVKFAANDTLREDARSPAGEPQEWRLAKITVTTPAGTVLRVFKLEQNYSTGRLTLAKLYETSASGDSLPPYTFTYDPRTLPAYSSASQDHWGYYNGKANSSLLPPADRNPDGAFMKAGVLTKITYPTGGYNEFFYEPNEYGGVGPNGDPVIALGPVESAWITWQWPQYTQSTEFTVEGDFSVIATLTVSVGPPDCDPTADDGCPITEILRSNGLLVGAWSAAGTYQVELETGTYTLRILDNRNTTDDGWAASGVEWREKRLGNATAGGLRVAQIHTADAMEGIGQTTVRKYLYKLESEPTRSSGIVGSEPDYDHSYISPGCSYNSRSSTSKMPLGAGSPGQVAYREVMVLHGANGEFGQTRSTFRSFVDAPDALLPPTARWPHSTRTSYEWARGHPKQITEYNGVAQPQLRTASTHTIREFADPEPVRRFRGMSIHAPSGGQYGSFVYYSSFEVIAGWAYQNGETRTVFDTTGQNSFSTTRAFVYGNPAHAQLTEITETNSDGTQRITRMKYPADYAIASSGEAGLALNAMQGTAHMHNAVIERWVSRRVGTSESVVEAELTTYKQYGPGQYLPHERFVLNNPSPLP